MHRTITFGMMISLKIMSKQVVRHLKFNKKKTRGTRGAQTSAAPSLMSVRCQRHFMKISWKSARPFFHDISNNHNFIKQQNLSCIQGLSCNILEMFQIVPYLMCNIWWTFHENPFINFPLMLLTDMDFPENVEKDFLNGTSRKCSRLFLAPSFTYPDNFMEIRSRVSVMLLSDKQTHKPTEMKP